MYPIFLTVFFGAMAMFYTAVEAPKRAEAMVLVEADVDATNFIAYRRAIQSYLQANPNAAGVVGDTSLGPFWPTGYLRDSNWTNIIDGGALYVYSTAPVAPGTLKAIWNRSGESALVGTKNPSNGRLRSFNGFDTGIVLPAVIPGNAVVMMGK